MLTRRAQSRLIWLIFQLRGNHELPRIHVLHSSLGPAALPRTTTAPHHRKGFGNIGVSPDCNYPVCDVPLAPGDRFLLYTDGVTEPENATGEQFGDHRLEQIVRDNQSRPACELSDRLLSELRAWQPAPLTQQDDITLIVIDVV